eukprot:EG_transcript_10509
MGPKPAGPPRPPRLCLAAAAVALSGLPLLYAAAPLAGGAPSPPRHHAVPPPAVRAAAEVEDDLRVIITTNVAADIKPLLLMPAGKWDVRVPHRVATPSPPRPSPEAGHPAQTLHKPERDGPAAISRTPCPQPLQRRGRWGPRRQTTPALQLFRLPLQQWYRPEDPQCDFMLVEPAQACQCLHKVAFVGDSITMGFFQIFAEYLSQQENIILRRNVSAAEDTKDCFGGPLYDPTGHIRYKPCIPLMENRIHATGCGLHVHYLRVNKYMPGKDGTERELRRFLLGLAAADPAPIDLVLLNFGLHHMVAWNDRILASYPGFVRRALEVALDAAPAASVLWLGITAQHAAKKPPQWRNLQSNERVRQFNDAAFKAVDELRVAVRATATRLAAWDVLPMTETPEADAMSWDGVHYVRHLNTMRTLILLSHLSEPQQRCRSTAGGHS